MGHVFAAGTRGWRLRESDSRSHTTPAVPSTVASGRSPTRLGRRSAILVAADVESRPQAGLLPRQLISSNTPGERLANFSRAVGVDNMVFVAGTTASDEAGATQHPGDAAAQTTYVLRKIESALGEAGTTLADVVRTRVFMRNIEDSEAVAQAHGSIFADIRSGEHLAARRADRLGDAGRDRGRRRDPARALTRSTAGSASTARPSST